jgi:hypothetical protein
MSVENLNGLDVEPRRRVLYLLALTGFGLPFASRALAATDSSSNTTKGGAWLLGDKLSLAALLYNQGAPAETVNRVLSGAKTIADIFGVEIKPFPTKSGTSSESTADVLHYLIKGDGALIGAALAKKYDEEHGTLFEVAVKSNLLILLYAPGDSLGQSIAGLIKSRLGPISSLPPALWTGVVTLVENKRSSDEVKDAVFKMHKDVANFYIPGSA